MRCWSQSQQLLTSGPSVSASVGPIGAIRLYCNGAGPRRTRIARSSTSGCRRRCTRASRRSRRASMPAMSGIEELRPGFAALRLYEHAVDAAGMTVHDEVEQAVISWPSDAACRSSAPRSRSRILPARSRRSARCRRRRGGLPGGHGHAHRDPICRACRSAPGPGPWATSIGCARCHTRISARYVMSALANSPRIKALVDGCGAGVEQRGGVGR